jgi:hypothetical protein
MRYLKVVLPVALIAASLVACSPKLPQADVDAANAAFNDAKTAQADVFAADSWKAASDANDALQANLTAKDYGKTKALAKTLLDDSTKAKADAATGLEAAKANVTQLGTDISALLPTVQKELSLAVKAGKKAKVDVKTLKATIDAAPQALTDAQANTDVAAAQSALTTIKTSLTDAQGVLEAAGYKAN